MKEQRRTKSTLTSVAAVLAVCTFANPVFAVDIVDDPTQIDERVTQLLQTANSLSWEIYRFHQQQPEYAEIYRVVKDVWTQAGQIQESLRTRPVETEVLTQQISDMNKAFTSVEQRLSQWDTGDRSALNATSGQVQRTVVREGVGVDIPFIGVRVGSPQVVVTEEVPTQIERKRLHPNSRGSKRSLERELAATRVALNYLIEDAGATAQPDPQTTNGASQSGAVPQPPKPGLTDDTQVVPARAKVPTSRSTPK